MISHWQILETTIKLRNNKQIGYWQKFTYIELIILSHQNILEEREKARDIIYV
jgi:hypothetical protein